MKKRKQWKKSEVNKNKTQFGFWRTIRCYFFNKTKTKKYLVYDLLKIADRAFYNPTPEAYYFNDFIIESINGWLISVFFDAGEMDYINYFRAPNGDIINVYQNCKCFQQIGLYILQEYNEESSGDYLIKKYDLYKKKYKITCTIL